MNGTYQGYPDHAQCKRCTKGIHSLCHGTDVYAGPAKLAHVM